MKVVKTAVKCKVGVHARPAAMLIKLSDKYRSKIEIEFKGRTIGINSIIGLLSLGIKCNDEIIVKADGEDEVDAVAAVIELLQQNEI